MVAAVAPFVDIKKGLKVSLCSASGTQLDRGHAAFFNNIGAAWHSCAARRLISAFKSTKIHVKKDGLVSINNTDTSRDSAALVALLSALADKP